MVGASVFAWRHFSAESAYWSIRHGADQVRAALVYNLVVAALTVLVAVVLAVVVRRPLRWVRPAAWCVLGFLGLALFLGLNAGADPAGSTAGPNADSDSRAYYDLLPHWYPTLNAIQGVAVLVLVVAVFVMLLRSSVADFYRPASTEQDPKWSSFVAAQQKRIAGDET
ncbi:hypothetical protein GCM10010172_72860 [Paractinoplanes ferrugineus]|uniref:Uncharacterized protein n=2 Tax=Paractinoplanes ferrugineus TaxID=113564 RepID=A0A919J305_9ACTN|nr:hypothetical protein Afe05nite_33990 [Actinoplanes ferrugineus]